MSNQIDTYLCPSGQHYKVDRGSTASWAPTLAEAERMVFELGGQIVKQTCDEYEAAWGASRRAHRRTVGSWPTTTIPEGYVDMPVPKPGVGAGHQFGGIDGRCFYCDRRPGSTSAAYDCDEEAPRLLVSRDSLIAETNLQRLATAVAAAGLLDEEE